MEQLLFIHPQWNSCCLYTLNGTVAISANMYNSRICPDGRKIVVTSGLEIAQNDKQVKKNLQQMGFYAILFKQCLTSYAESYSDMAGVNLKLRSIRII